MARDRQRAKQRRAKRQSGGGSGAGGPGSSRTRARDIGLDDASADDAGVGSTRTPAPTEHAMPDVDMARMAEAGAQPPDVGEELPDDLERAPDEVEGDVVLPGQIDPAVAEERAGRPRKRRGRVITFLGHCIDELRRVQWPDRRQTGQGTAVVLGFVVLAGGYLGLLDALWKPLIEAIL